jgi:tetratricopeptide (TPR) repeat protein
MSIYLKAAPRHAPVLPENQVPTPRARPPGAPARRGLMALVVRTWLPVALPLLAPLLAPLPSAQAGKDKESDKSRVKKEQAKQFYEDGMVQYDLRKFEDAIESFEKAYKAFPNAAFLFNLAQAHRMAGHTADAIGFYNNYLRRMPDAGNVTDVKKFIAELETTKKTTPEVAKLPPLPPPQPYLEHKSKHNFLTRMSRFGTDYALTGASFRSYIGFTIYGVGMYVEEEPARRAFPKLVEKAGGSDLQLLRARDLAQSFVVLGEFGKLGIMYFVRDVPAEKIRDAYRGVLKENLKPTASPQLRQQTDAFLALFDRDMKTGEELAVGTTADGKIFVAVGAVKKDGPQSPTLAIDLWNLWLGPQPMSKDLKQGLVERIQALGQTAAAPPATPGRPSP